jgi:hypothetical protein
LKLFKYLTTSELKTYRYAASEEVVKEKIAEVFSKSGKLLSDPDFDGRFTGGNSFEMSVNSGAVTSGNAKFGSILHGEISALDSQETIIANTIKARFPIKLIAMVTPLLGLAYSYQIFINFSWQSFIICGAMILLSPLLCNWLANVFNAAIQERFEFYIDREIRQITGPDIGLPKAR